MKNIVNFLFFWLPICLFSQTKAGSPLFFNLNDSISYVLGVDMGKQVLQARQNMEKDSVVKFNMDIVMMGVLDAQVPSKMKFSEEEMQTIISHFNIVMNEAISKRAEATKLKASVFFEENKKKVGVKVTESGLQYKVISEGNAGEKPTINDTVTVHYIGKLLDGTIFDSSVERKKPTTFPLASVITGWTEGLQLMKPGDKFILYIPSELGYGEQGGGEKIPPNEPLIFEIELIKVKKANTQLLPKPKVERNKEKY